MSAALDTAGQQSKPGGDFFIEHPPAHAAKQQLMDGYTLRGLSLNSTMGSSIPTFITSFGKQRLKRTFGSTQLLPAFFADLGRVTSKLRLVEAGRYAEQGFLRDFVYPTQRLNLGDMPCTISYLGSGHYGLVFKLLFEQGDQYALKTFYHSPIDCSLSGPWSETATGLFITAHRVSDMPHLLAANPETGWILSEFVDHSYRTSCPDGPCWKELELTARDSVKDKSNILDTEEDEHIRVDYGHLHSIHRICWRPGPEYQALAEQTREQGKASTVQFLDVFRKIPSARPALFDKLGHVEEADRFEVLKQMLQYPEACFVRLQSYLATEVFPVEMTRSLFDLTEEQKNPLWRGQAIFDIRKLSKEDANYLGRIWSSRPEFEPFMFYLKS